MNADELDRSARADEHPPAGLSGELRALWLARAGRWHDAHNLCQDLPDPAGAWIHAHLHREEGDPDNAAYWYRRARRTPPPPSLSIDDEWRELAEHFSAGS